MQNFHRKIDSLSQKCNYSKKNPLVLPFYLMLLEMKQLLYYKLRCLIG